RFGNCRMREEGRLHLRGEYRIPAAQDQLTLAARDLDVAVGRDPDQVAGLEPAVGVEHGPRFLGIVEVTVQRGWTLDPELADFVRCNRAPDLVYGAREDTGNGPPDRVGNVGRLAGEIGNRTEQFGHAIAAQDPNARSRAPFLGQLPRARSRAGQRQ